MKKRITTPTWRPPPTYPSRLELSWPRARRPTTSTMALSARVMPTTSSESFMAATPVTHHEGHPHAGEQHQHPQGVPEEEEGKAEHGGLDAVGDQGAGPDHGQGAQGKVQSRQQVVGLGHREGPARTGRGLLWVVPAL